MPRYRLLIEYDGTSFIGWQAQAADAGASVQGELERACLKLTGDIADIRGAGRTDAGVHALGQVAHVDLRKPWAAFRLREALNFHLKPNPIAILDCSQVEATFDARFSAISRSYIYKVLCRRAPPALERHRVWWIRANLDHAAMAQAAVVLLGRHDFTTFRAAACQAKSPLRTLDRLEVTREGDLIVIRVQARSFLHNQVRSMVGSLKLVGLGQWQAHDLKAALEARNRAACGPVAPAHGLYLVRVDYPASEAFGVGRGGGAN